MQIYFHSCLCLYLPRMTILVEGTAFLIKHKIWAFYIAAVLYQAKCGNSAHILGSSAACTQYIFFIISIEYLVFFNHHLH